jgi:enoyl-CoA hydratase/carnithine racemase
MSFLDYTVIRIETFGEYNRVVLLGERRNAFSRQLIERLSGVDCDKDLVITNEGPVFSAGLDLSVFLQSKDAVLEYLFSVHRLVKRLISCGGRVVVHVLGDVYGFGVEFLYFADYVVAQRENMKFSLQGVNFGVFPPYTIAIGRRLFSHGHLRVMLSREFDAKEASHFGIVSQIGQLELEKLFKPPPYLLGFVRPRHWLGAVVDDAVPYLYKLAEVGTREETRGRIRKFLSR